MTINNQGKITAATRDELYTYYLAMGYDDIYSFDEYLERVKECGIAVIGDG